MTPAPRAKLKIDVLVDSALWKEPAKARAIVRRAVAAAANAQSTTPTELAIVLTEDSAIRQLYGIRLAKTEWSSGHENLRVYGRVAADETRIYRVNVGTDGYVKSTSGDAVGNHVLKNQHLAVIYSPEFLSVAGPAGEGVV